MYVLGEGFLTPWYLLSTVVLINVTQLETTEHLSFKFMFLLECWVLIAWIQWFLKTLELKEGMGTLYYFQQMRMSRQG